MELYNLELIFYLKNLAASLAQAKNTILSNATKLNKFQKRYLNHIVEKVIEEEKENVGDAIAEMAEQTIDLQKQAAKDSHFVRLKKPKTNPELVKGREDAVSNLIEFKKKLPLFQMKSHRESVRIERVKARNAGVQVEEDRAEAIVNFIRNNPAEICVIERQNYIKPLSIWKNATKNSFIKNRPPVLKTPKQEVFKPQFLFNEPKALNRQQRRSITDDYGFIQERRNSRSLTKSPFQHRSSESKTERSLDEGHSSFESTPAQFLLPQLDKMLQTKLQNTIAPILIQGLVTNQKKLEPHTPSFICDGPISIREMGREIIEKKLNHRTGVALTQPSVSESPEKSIFRDRNKYDCVNTECGQLTGPYMLPSIRPQKPLSSKLPPFVTTKPIVKKPFKNLLLQKVQC